MYKLVSRCLRIFHYLRLESQARMGQSALLYSSVIGHADLPTFTVRM